MGRKKGLHQDHEAGRWHMLGCLGNVKSPGFSHWASEIPLRNGLERISCPSEEMMTQVLMGGRQQRVCRDIRQARPVERMHYVVVEEGKVWCWRWLLHSALAWPRESGFIIKTGAHVEEQMAGQISSPFVKYLQGTIIGDSYLEFRKHFYWRFKFESNIKNLIYCRLLKVCLGFLHQKPLNISPVAQWPIDVFASSSPGCSPEGKMEALLCLNPRSAIYYYKCKQFI